MLQQCALHLQIKVMDKVLIKKIELLFIKKYIAYISELMRKLP